MEPSWHFLTGEYPPARGGVGDYTRRVATALAASGGTVHVWAPRKQGPEPEDAGVEVHRLPGLGPSALAKMGEEMDRLPAPRRLFVQYVPTGLGWRGMNVPLVRWLAARRDEIWVQFHEVALGWSWWRNPHLHLTHAVQLWMAGVLARRADKIFISIEGWRRRLGAEGPRAIGLPIPSNVPEDVSELSVAAARRELGPGPWIGHFGTYGSLITRDLGPALSRIATTHPRARILLLGRGAREFAATLGLGPRVRAEADLPAEAIAARLCACDLLVQPYPDGISSRRTSAMAGLALGVPTVTTAGHLTDDIWRKGTAVDLVPVGKPDDLAQACLALLADPGRRRALGQAGAALYREHLSLERTLRALGVPPDAKVAASE
jgi:glycosyltransferase involved in cell wall biosynthesis